MPPAVLAPRRLRHQYCNGFEASLVYIDRPACYHATLSPLFLDFKAVGVHHPPVSFCHLCKRYEAWVVCVTGPGTPSDLVLLLQGAQVRCSKGLKGRRQVCKSLGPSDAGAGRGSFQLLPASSPG